MPVAFMLLDCAFTELARMNSAPATLMAAIPKNRRRLISSHVLIVFIGDSFLIDGL